MIVSSGCRPYLYWVGGVSYDAVVVGMRYVVDFGDGTACGGFRLVAPNLDCWC